MIGRTLAFVGCVLVFVAVAVPHEDESAGELALGSSATGAGQSSSASGSQASSDWFAGDHALERQADGHFYASALVDGASLRMMVDTGASVIALTAADASAAGLYWDDAEVRPIGQGASGTVYGVPAQLDEVEIGGMVRRNVAAVIIPEGLRISLLGQSYLKQISGVEIADNRMILSGN